MKHKSGWTQNERYDYSLVPEKTFEPLPAGLYFAKITEAKTADDKPQIIVTLQVFENAAGEKINRKVDDYLTQSQAALFRTKNLADSLGIPGPEGNGLETCEQFCRDILAAGERVYVRLKVHTYQGRDGKDRTTNKVARYLKESEVQQDTSLSNGASVSSSDAPMMARRRSSVAATA